MPILSSVGHRLSSRAVGSDFQVSVVLPRSYATDTSRRFPVVYLLDGNELTGVAASLAWELRFTGAPEVILVGIDYPVPSLDGSQGTRFRDLTPSTDSGAVAAMASEYRALGLPEPTASGGASAFLSLLTDDLIPFVDSVYRTQPTERTLLGFSLGGLFAMHVLLERPEHFRNYIALSPSLWWDGGELLTRVARLNLATDAPRRLFVSIGLLEENPTYRMVTDVRALEQALRTYAPSALEWHVQYFPDENHSSGWPGAMSRGLRYVFGVWSPPPRAE